MRSADEKKVRLALVLVAATLLMLALGGCGSTSGDTSSAGADSSTGSGAAAGSSSTPSVPSHPAPVRRPVRRPSPAPAAGLGRRTRTSGCQVRGQLPDPACTPGAVFAAATVAQICTPGYASSVRNVPESLKRRVSADYGTEPSVPGSYEVDHLVPLELGGSNAIANLWPEIAPGYQEKDQVENELHDAVCAGQIGLAVAQRTIARDWRHAGVPVTVPARGSGAGGPVSPGTPVSPGSGSTGAEGPGSSTHAGDAAFCSSHSCIANFPNGHGTVVQCADGMWSHSGGRTGVCNRHGGPR